QEIGQYKDQLARPSLVDQEIVDGLVHDLYDRQQEEVSASHILVRIPSPGAPADTLEAYLRMESLRDSVLAGTPFGDIAQRNSDDPSAKQNKGYLGVFTGGRMIKAFEDKAYQTPVGEMSDIFRTRFGYHILQVHSRGKRSPDIRAAHILIRTSDDDSTKALATIHEIMQKLDEGVEFSDLAKEYSEDQGSAQNGGDLGFFGRGRMVAPFEEAAFGLKKVGDVSAPVRTRFGYHLIKLLDVGTLPTFDEAYDDLKTLVQRLPRFKTAETALALSYKEQLGSSIDTMAVEQLTASFPQDSVLFHLALENWSDDQKATVIARLGDHEYTLGDFMNYGSERRNEAPQSYDLNETLSMIDRMLTDRALDVEASHLEDRDADFKDLMDEYRDGIVLFRIMEDSVWNRANTDTLGLMKIYEQNAVSYRFPERKRVISFYSKSDSVLNGIAKEWTPGDTTDWAGRIDEEGFRVDTTFVSDSTNSIYDQAMPLSVGQTTQPIRYRRGFMLLALDGLEAPRQKTFKEARADVVTTYQSQVEEEWLKRLREKYHAVLYPENLRYAFNDIAPAGMNPSP
ncbi:MAG: peptidylprolyl isomerase, partial [Rhodothermales bacterium]